LKKKNGEYAEAVCTRRGGGKKEGKDPRDRSKKTGVHKQRAGTQERREEKGGKNPRTGKKGCNVKEALRKKKRGGSRIGAVGHRETRKPKRTEAYEKPFGEGSRTIRNDQKEAEIKFGV